MKKGFYTLLVVGVFSITGCNDDENVSQTTCDDVVILDSDRFKDAITDFFTLIDVTIEGDCMTVEYSSSGCDGNSWVMELIDAEVIKESNPVQRDLRLLLKNEELCRAVFTKEISFDLTPLRTSDNEILLNLEGEQYTYTY
ncbi:MAG: hypothetical protein AAGA64_01565 [Bacteroidota bacterium]